MNYLKPDGLYCVYARFIGWMPEDTKRKDAEQIFYNGLAKRASRLDCRLEPVLATRLREYEVGYAPFKRQEFEVSHTAFPVEFYTPFNLHADCDDADQDGVEGWEWVLGLDMLLDWDRRALSCIPYPGGEPKTVIQLEQSSPSVDELVRFWTYRYAEDLVRWMQREWTYIDDPKEAA